MLPLNLPNLLTLSRILLALVFFVFVLREVWPTAFWLFVTAVFTDLMDGTAARLLNKKTRAGAILDGVADKILMSLGFISLTAKGWLPLWLTLLVLSKDLMVTFGVIFFGLKKINLTYRATILSKTATFFQALALSFALINASFGTGDTVYGYDRLLAALLTILAAVQYFSIGLGLLKETKCAK
ncbi:MAG: CDP-alcohol phosphatidyltransferase family protein [Deltaproteobacteria bacterium]|nr:CDP-alcohol phosphatidyltransferase family protein [Deltaproteobacteria bacterium]